MSTGSIAGLVENRYVLQRVGMATISLPSQIARTRRFSLGIPEQFTIGRDGAAVLFLRSRAGDDPVSRLWLLDLDTGMEHLLADPEKLLWHQVRFLQRHLCADSAPARA